MTVDPATRAPTSLERALSLPDGARFHRCALHVNPFGYRGRSGHPAVTTDEQSYNAALVETALDSGVEALGIADHYRIFSASSLIETATQAGLTVFPGFEAKTNDGVHFVCLFEVGTSLEIVNRRIGECGVPDDTAASPLGQFNANEFLARAHDWGALCIAAHVAGGGGLLREKKGQPRIEAWTSPHLLAVSLPGSAKDAPSECRPILLNQDAAHEREYPVAIVNAKDVSAPDQLAHPSHSSLIKMSEISISGLRQAFLDPESRIRAVNDPDPVDRTRIVALAWKGGFLDGTAVHLNDDLNVLVGGRGAGKSTVIETIRYLLDLEPVGDEARATHEGIVRQVLRGGTSVSALVHSHHPSSTEYIVERTVPNPPTVREASSGRVLDLTPQDIAPGTEVYGQHEISEVAGSARNRTRLLDRFLDEDPGSKRRKASVARELAQSRTRLLAADEELERLEERLAVLPGVEETLRRFREAGVEDRLKDRSLLVQEERVLATARERLEPLTDRLEELRAELPLDRAFVTTRALEGLPGGERLAPLEGVLERLEKATAAATASLGAAVGQATSEIAAVEASWDQRRRDAEAAYEKLLRELQKSQIDGGEFIELRRQLEELRPLQQMLETQRHARAELAVRRGNLLLEWEDVKAEEFRALDRAARKVSKRLAGQVRVQVAAAADREPLAKLLKENVGGRLGEAIEALKRREELSLPALARAMRSGRDAVVKEFALPAGQAQRLVEATEETLMRLEELELPSSAQLELNVAPAGSPEKWQQLDDLSTGQKATAILLLLLLESDAPLIVDQPEDDLDNRFITEGVVPKMREEKRKRQFLFATHNANIPVLGDAELILGLSPGGDASSGLAEIPEEHMGSIDREPVRELVEELLEGGHEAFEDRRRRYGF
jgi:ABC-type cobalamin/Fe3+-siderophores transport system ATPase subunit